MEGWIFYKNRHCLLCILDMDMVVKSRLKVFFFVDKVVKNHRLAHKHSLNDLDAEFH